MQIDRTNPISDQADLKHSGLTRPKRSISSLLSVYLLSSESEESETMEWWIDAGGDCDLTTTEDGIVGGSGTSCWTDFSIGIGRE